jgi:hypothetical protein
MMIAVDKSRLRTCGFETFEVQKRVSGKGFACRLICNKWKPSAATNRSRSQQETLKRFDINQLHKLILDTIQCGPKSKDISWKRSQPRPYSCDRGGCCSATVAGRAGDYHASPSLPKEIQERLARSGEEIESLRVGSPYLPGYFTFPGSRFTGVFGCTSGAASCGYAYLAAGESIT